VSADRDGPRIRHVDYAAPLDVPVRARATEQVLEGARPTPQVADVAAETLAGELTPIDDVRSTADYRRTVSARILHRLLRDAGGW